MWEDGNRVQPPRDPCQGLQWTLDRCCPRSADCWSHSVLHPHDQRVVWVTFFRVEKGLLGLIQSVLKLPQLHNARISRAEKGLWGPAVSGPGPSLAGVSPLVT